MSKRTGDLTKNGSPPIGKKPDALRREAEPSSGSGECKLNRRKFLAGAAGIAGMIAISSCDWQAFVQQHFKRMSEEDIKRTLERLEADYKAKFGKDFVVGAEGPIDGTLFGYALDIQRCIGCRKCVHACVEENNLSRDPEIQYIRVLRFENGTMDLEKSDIYYDTDRVPQEGYFYMPVQCQHCENSRCEQACPIGATWKEPDGIVVVDYNWCIGCRYCLAACPYMARWFNWADPVIPEEKLNTDTHYLGNRPRMRNVMEKCHFCIHRVRKGRYPACVEACPVGARKFGNLLDPESEISWILKNKRVFRLKEDLNTQPKFYYFFAT